MAVRPKKLSQFQMRVLQWIADGCPEGVWTDYRYKTSVYALANRGLVTVDRRRDSWSAQITGEGKHYLKHETYRNEAVTTSRRSERASRATSHVVAADELIDSLRTHGGKVTISNPTCDVRAAYRSAIHKAITDGLVAPDMQLRYSGRDKGDLCIWLAQQEEPAVSAVPKSIPLPDDLRHSHPAVRDLRDRVPEALNVSPDQRRRALLILQAIADECERRGHEFGVSPDDAPAFRITVAGVPTDFVLFEEHERRSVPVEKELAEARYSWQRVRSAVQRVPSGRLAIKTGTSYQSSSWADRKRWTLVSRLSHVLGHAEEVAQETLERRAEAERELAERRRLWEETKSRARVQFIEDLKRRRLDNQIANARRANEIRRFADEISQATAETSGSENAAGIEDWIAWARSEADRVDPLLNPRALRFVEPEDIRDADLDPYMPHKAH